ncbi:MAG: tetratricopeptide repeat protein [Bacteroidota bacterium]
MKKNVTLFFIFFSAMAFSQSNSIDSLKALLKAATQDSTRCRILNVMVETDQDDTKWPFYNEQLRVISQSYYNTPKSDLRDHFVYYYALSLSNFGYLSMQKGMTSNAYEYYYKALNIYKEINNKQGVAIVLVNLGYLFRQDGNITKAIEAYHNALKVQIEIKDINGAATSYNNIGFIFDNQGETAKALEYYNKALDSYIQMKDKDGMAISYSNIAYLFKTYGDPSCKSSTKECQTRANKKAINYLNLSVKLREEIKDKYGIASSYNLLGGIYDFYGDPECPPNINCDKESSEKALDYYKKALNIRVDLKSLKGMAQSYGSLADYMFRHGDINGALDYGIKSLNVSKELGSPENIRDAAFILQRVFQKQNQFQKSLQMYQLYIQMRDTIDNEETKEIILKKGFQIEYEKKATADSVRVSEEKKVTTAQLKQEKTQRFALYGGLVLVGLFGAFMFNRFKVTQKQNHLIQQQKSELQKQKELVEEHQKETLDSIHYAKRIQTALIANTDFISKRVPHNFILFKPKDIVSGDFYWATEHHNKFYLAICDSTGHGVPGAFMSLLNMGFLSEAIKEKNITKPNDVFNYVRERLISTISDGGQKDGMDGILICVDNTTNRIEYAAANNEPILIRDNEIVELPKDKMPVGKGERDESFKLYTVDLKTGDTLYLYTDGYADQFGGPKGKKFKYRQLNELLLGIKDKPLQDQSAILESTFLSWKGSQEQVDDVLIIGIKM